MMRIADALMVFFKLCAGAAMGCVLVLILFVIAKIVIWAILKAWTFIKWR